MGCDPGIGTGPNIDKLGQGSPILIQQFLSWNAQDISHRFHLHFLMVASITYHNDLLAPYLSLAQGDKIQAECWCLFVYCFLLLRPFFFLVQLL
jgi:hypothetical protein